MARAAEVAIVLDHPAYDCMYLALAMERGTPLVTADVRLLGKLAPSPYAAHAMALASAAALG